MQIQKKIRSQLQSEKLKLGQTSGLIVLGIDSHLPEPDVESLELVQRVKAKFNEEHAINLNRKASYFNSVCAGNKALKGVFYEHQSRQSDLDQISRSLAAAAISEGFQVSILDDMRVSTVSSEALTRDIDSMDRRVAYYGSALLIAVWDESLAEAPVQAERAVYLRSQIEQLNMPILDLQLVADTDVAKAEHERLEPDLLVAVAA